MGSTDYDAIIIGAGHNGLVTAGYLSRAGFKTLVLERREFVGGACVTEELFKGYQVSSCSYISHLLQTKVVNDLELKKFGFQVFPLEPRRFGPFLNPRRHILLWHETEKTAKEIRRISEADSKSYEKWMDFWTQAARVIHYYFLLPPPSEDDLLSKAKEFGAKDVFERVLSSTLRDLLEEFFESEEIRGYFCNIGQDLGDPDAKGGPIAAAYFYCNEFTDSQNYGLVKGGMGGITKALASSAEHHGATILKNAEVERILVKDGKTIGVRLKDGREFSSRIVVSNADPKRTFLRLMEPDSLDSSFLSKVKNLKTSIAYFKFHCTLRELPDFSSYLGSGADPSLLAQIRITQPVDLQKKAWNEVQNGKPSRSPIMSIQIPTVKEPGLAPQGRHILSIWSQFAPVHLANNVSWDSARESEGKFLIDTISSYSPNFNKAIIDWSLFTPADIEQRVYLTDGNIRHLDMVPDQLFSSRPMAGWAQYETPVENLYLCGAGTHPGGEVTGAPGHNAAQAIIRKLKNN